MKTLIKTLVFVILLAFAVIAWLFVRQKPEKDASPLEKAAVEAVKMEAKITARKVDSQGFEHVVTEVTNNVLRDGSELDSAARREIDSLLKVVEIKDKQLRGYTKVVARLEDSLLTATRTDKGWEYTDKWVSLSLDNPTATDSAMFSFRYNAEVNIAEYWKRRWFFGRKRHYMDIWLSDPRARINSVKRLKIEPTRRSMGFSLQAIGDYAPTGDVYMGFGGTIKAGRFNLTGAYMNDLNGAWYPSFRGSYDLLSW